MLPATTEKKDKDSEKAGSFLFVFATSETVKESTSSRCGGFFYMFLYTDHAQKAASKSLKNHLRFSCLFYW
jgi:hypothetical protein